jgi:hypothetical protein
MLDMNEYFDLYEADDEESQDDLNVVLEARWILQGGACAGCGNTEVPIGDRYMDDEASDILICGPCAGYSDGELF